MASQPLVGSKEGNITVEKHRTGEIMDNSSLKRAISLEDDKEDAIDWVEGETEAEDDRVELGLVGKIWTGRHINVNAFMATIKNIWQPKHGLDISAMGKNMFAFQFYHWRDKQRVLEGQPWHFDHHALLLEEIDESIRPSDMEIFAFPMWVRVYNLPFKGRLINANVEAIGNKIGRFVKMDASGLVGIDKSVRIRILIDVRKPLKQQIKIKMRGGIEDFFEVKYEKPPLFCYHCGLLGHGLKDCDDYKGEEETKTKYGEWLKASPWRHSKQGEERRGENGANSCARQLFVTKPKQWNNRKEKAESEQMNEVVEKLQFCGLQSHLMAGNLDDIGGTGKEKVTGVTGDAEDSRGVMVIKEKETVERDKEKTEVVRKDTPGIHGETIAGELPTENVPQHIEVATVGVTEDTSQCEASKGPIRTIAKKKKWVKILKDGHMCSEGGTFKAGMVRKERDFDDSVMTEQGLIKSRKRRVNEDAAPVEDMQVDDMRIVAGPTPWALGDQ